MKHLYFFAIFILLILSENLVKSQLEYLPEDVIDSLKEVHSHAIDSVIIETYYISDKTDATASDGGYLPTGSVTYRIFVDMKSEYNLKAVYAYSTHSVRYLSIKTDSVLFNNEYAGEYTGSDIRSRDLTDNTVLLDSWFTLNKVTGDYVGVLKSEDNDGSIFNNSDFLHNNSVNAGIPISEADGLIESSISDVPSKLTIHETELNNYLGYSNVDSLNFVMTDFVLYNPNGVKGPTETNRVLIGQFTTNGKLELKLNIQLGYNDTIRKALCDSYNTKFCYNNIIHFVHELAIGEEDLEVSAEKGQVTFIYQSNEMILEKNSQISVGIVSNEEYILNVYPNPVSEKIKVVLPESVRSYRYKVYDIYGRVILENELGIAGPEEVKEIEATRLSGGLYILKIYNGVKTYHNSFIKR